MAYQDLDSIHRPSNGAVAPPQWGDQVNDDVAYLHGLATTPLAWTGLTYAGGITDYGRGYAGGAYCQDIFGTVRMRGLIEMPTGFAVGATITTLPAGSVPLNREEFSVLIGGLYTARVDVEASGIVALSQVDPRFTMPVPAGGTYLTLSCIMFGIN